MQTIPVLIEVAIRLSFDAGTVSAMNTDVATIHIAPPKPIIKRPNAKLQNVRNICGATESVITTFAA